MSKKFPLICMLLLVLLFSCHSDDDTHDTPDCYPTFVSMKINGQSQTFLAVGYGISMNAGGGYTLGLNLDQSESVGSSNHRAISIRLPYKLTGVNAIQHFEYISYWNDVAFHGDFTDGVFTSNVIINKNTCFLATFSGTLSDGNQQITITDGVLSYLYPDPFDN